MAHAWKACWVHALAGSNPASSATLTSADAEPPASGRLGVGLFGAFLVANRATRPLVGLGHPRCLRSVTVWPSSCERLVLRCTPIHDRDSPAATSRPRTRIDGILSRRPAFAMAVGLVREGRLRFFDGHGLTDNRVEHPVTASPRLERGQAELAPADTSGGCSSRMTMAGPIIPRPDGLTRVPRRPLSCTD
jgi:hypothetical protein